MTLMPEAATVTLEAPSLPRNGPVLRTAVRDDGEAIHALLRDALRDTPADGTDWQAEWAWQGWNNPFRGGRPVGWVLTEGDRLIGHLGAVYVPMRIGSQGLLGVIVSAYCVAADAAARGGMLLGLQLAQAFFDSAKANDCLSLAMSANEKTGAVFARFGCKPVAWTREFFGVSPCVAAEIRACWGGTSRIARRIQTSPLGPWINGLAAKTCQATACHPAIPLPAGCCLTVHTDIGEWIAALAHLDAQCSVGTFGVERSAEYLQWRYLRHPEAAAFRLLLMQDALGAIQGAAIVFRDERPDRHRGLVEDVIAPMARPDVVKALLCAAVRWASDEGLERLITAPGRPAFRPLYWELGFETGARSAPAAVVPLEILGTAEFDQGFEFWHGAMF